MGLLFYCLQDWPVLSHCFGGPGRAPASHQCLAPPPGQMWTSEDCQTPLLALWWRLSPDGPVNRRGNVNKCCLRAWMTVLWGHTAVIHWLVYSWYPFRQFELQQAALSEGRLEDLHQLHWLTGRQTRHQLQKLVHKTVLQVGQLWQKQPAGGRSQGDKKQWVETEPAKFI